MMKLDMKYCNVMQKKINISIKLKDNCKSYKLQGNYLMAMNGSVYTFQAFKTKSTTLFNSEYFFHTPRNILHIFMYRSLVII